MEAMELALLVGLIWRIWCRYKKPRKKRFWVRSILSARRQQSQYYHLLHEMRLHDDESHFRYTRMSRRSFDDLLHKVKPYLTRRRYTSSARPSISSAERLALTLRYLATGDSQTSISFNFRVGRSTVCNIVYETCCVLWKVLHMEYVQFPSTTQDWIGISQQFWRKWNFPNCLGAIDGKHILIQAPSNSGSLYYNYKGTYSIVLLAVCDANYRFIAFDIGEAGKESDSGIFSNSLLGQYLESQSLPLPQPASVPDVPDVILPYVFIGDEGFPLRKDLMRPFPGKNLPDHEAIFNYRLSRARRIIENTFGILAARFRIFRRPINANPDRVVAYTKATLALHNYLREKESPVYCPPGFTDGEDGEGNTINGSWREHTIGDNGLQKIGKVGSNHYSWTAKSVRECFSDYFSSSEGAVPWQDKHIHRTSYK